MKQRITIKLRSIILCTASMLAMPLTAVTEPAIVPKPHKMEVLQGSYKISEKTTIQYADDSAKDVAEYLANALNPATGLNLKAAKGETAGTGILLELLGDYSVLGDEGYNLTVNTDNITISAAKPEGLFYAAQTILQLLPPQILSRTRIENGKWEIPSVSIQDKPEFKWRGLMLDSGRYFQPVGFVKKFIDVMALHKMNTLHFHLTDDQGWRIEIKKYPRLTEIGATRKESPKRRAKNTGNGIPYGPFFYTQEELKDIVAYAKSRFITVVPEIEMPGHALAALSAYPALSCRGGPFSPMTRWGVEEDVYCAGNEQVFQFNEDVLSEVMAIFPSSFIHIGGDECPKSRWNHCPKCQARIKTEKLNDVHGLQSYFITRMEKFINANGRRLIGWDEILEGGLAPNAAVMSWRGEDGGIAAANEGHDVVMSPTSHCYFDYSQAEGPTEPEPVGRLLPLDKVYSYNPLPDRIASDRKKHILGVQGNLWSECLWAPAKVEYAAFPRACALAEVAWTPASARNYADFITRMKQHASRLDILKVNHRKIETP